MSVFLFSFSTYILFSSLHVSTIGVNNVVKYYTSFRRFCFCRCGIAQNQMNGIQNYDYLDGELYSPYEMPWLALIHTQNRTFRGTLISDKHIITAASPLYGIPTSHVKVTIGAQDQCKESHAFNMSVEAILVHSGYSDVARNNDIALLRLRHSIQFSQFIAPICMPIFEIGDTEQLAWTVSGLQTCLIRISTLPISTSGSCIRSAKIFNVSQITSDKGCLGPLGTKSIICEDEVGGPVMTRWMPGFPFRLAGVITSASCEKDIPSLFTKTVNNLLWIHENIRNDCQCF